MIYNPDGSKSIGAAIEVIQVNAKNSERITLGYTFTDEFGAYGFLLKVNSFSIYEFNVYSPIN
ncbi:hypothetical protein WJW32_01485 [Tepidibacter sp. Z1-5]